MKKLTINVSSNLKEYIQYPVDYTYNNPNFLIVFSKSKQPSSPKFGKILLGFKSVLHGVTFNQNLEASGKSEFHF